MLNASFLHETILFTLLLRHPLQSSSLSRPVRATKRLQVCADVSDPLPQTDACAPFNGHLWMQNGQWHTVVCGSDGATWFAAVTPALNVQLGFSSHDVEHEPPQCFHGACNHAPSAQERRIKQRKGFLASSGLLEGWIWPTEGRSDVCLAITADCVYV
jgi:hypothetical protein